MQRKGATMPDTDTPVVAVQVRLRGSLYTALNNWRRSQSKIPSQSQAVWQLIERALAEPDKAAAAS
jgi:hypothetical protein